MKKTLQLLAAGFESSSVKTPEFLEFAKVFKKELKAELNKEYIVTAIEFSVGHFDISGFFKLEDERIFYFSFGDVRWLYEKRLLIRTATDFKDYRGGCNNYVELGVGMFRDFQLPRI